MKRISLMLLVLLFSSLGFSQTTCGTDSAFGMKYKYCIHKNPKSQDLLHYFHVHGGSEKNWESQNTNKNIRKAWTAAGKEIPNVVTFSFGNKWLLTEVPQSGGVSRYYAFINKILPDLEAKVGNLTGRRLLMGDSMGGINSTFIMERNGNIFERVAINCPAITPIGPHAPQSEVNAYINRHKPYINQFYVSYMQNWGAAEFPSEEDWNRHSPLEIAKTTTALPNKIYVSCGEKDDFGFIEGSQKFAEIVAARGIDVTWVPIPNAGHCAVNSQAVATFLMP